MIYAASAFWLGALHALEPGHGKTVVAAYLVGERGRVRDAVLLGIVVTLTHTSSVIILAVLAMMAATRFVPEQIHHILELVGGILVLAVGLWMLLLRGRRSAGAHTHTHSHHDHTNSSDSAKAPLSLGGLVVLGISGGIVPCPAALAVLLAAVGTAQFARGVGLVVIFSVGLASVLVAIGIAMVRASEHMKRRLDHHGRWLSWAPVVSAAFITLVGLVLTVKALVGMEVL